MGLFSGISSFISNAVDTISSFFSGGSSSSSSSSGYGGIERYTGGSSSTHSYTTTTTNHNNTTTTYEPDRVKAAQLENERIELMRQAKLDIIQAETQSRAAQEQARAQGFAAMSQAIIVMQEKLNEIAEKRIAIIESASLQAIREAENFYGELTAKIQDDNNKYTLEKLPVLLDILGKYDEGSPAQKLYAKKIDEDMALQITHTAKQLESITERQTMIIDNILSVKGNIADQTGQITAKMLEVVKEKIEALDSGTSLSQEIPALPA